jgi:lysophospholipase L1-like esterase
MDRPRVAFALALALFAGCRSEDPPRAAAPAKAGASTPSAVPSLAASTAASTAPADAAAPSAGPRFVGYFDRSDPRGPKFAWPGSRIDLRFEGTSAKVRFADGSGGHVHFTIIVDGKESRLTLEPRDTTYVLAHDLPRGVHDVVLFRNSEALWGETQLLGFDVDGPLLAPPAPLRRLVFVGDSITCGYGTEGKGPRCGFVASEENAWRAWGAVAARDLDADVVLLAFSGGGIYRNNDGDREDTMPVRLLRTIPTRRTSPPVADDGPPPDAVVINLATNDWALGAPPRAEFEAAFGKLVDDLHRRWPTSRFVVALGPMLFGKALESTRTMETAIVASAKARGIDAELLELPMQDGHDGWGCQHHPNVARQRAMADALVAHLRGRLRL